MPFILLPKIRSIPWWYLCFSFVKPMIPRRVQILIRRVRARLILHFSDVHWPIDESAAGKPELMRGWPGGKKFSLVLTHDVESAVGLKKVLPLMELEKSLGVRSSFNFVAADYAIDSSIHSAIRKNRFETGVHGIHHNHRMYRSESAFQRHTLRINRVLKEWGSVGFRSPVMFHNLEWIRHLNILYDASTFDTDPFEPQSDGMRTIFPFLVQADHAREGYVELPYTLPQDHALVVVLQEKSPAIWKKKLDWIAEQGGMALMNVHPDYIALDDEQPVTDQYPVGYYREFLSYIRETYSDQYWNALPGEMADFWMKNCTGTEVLSQHHRDTLDGRKHVCMPTYSFYESDNRVRRYAESLVREGHSVDIVCLRAEGQPAKEILKGVHVFRIQRRTKNEAHQLTYLFKLALFLVSSSTFLAFHHLRRRYDLIHVHNIPDFEVFAAFIPKLLGCKVILDIHDIVPELFCSKFESKENSFLFRLLCFVEKISIGFADHVIVANDIWYKKVTRRNRCLKKSSVILNYPDPNIFSNHGENKGDNNGKQVFIFPGSLNHHQGVDLAVEAFARIANRLPNAEFHIYGSGPDKALLMELIAQKDLGEKIQMKPTVPLDQIPGIMKKATCGVVPKRADNFGNQAFSTKIFEFMALGIPVIVSDTEIDRYYFDDSLVLFFKSGNVVDLAEKMILISENEALRAQLQANSREFIKDHSWDKKQSKYLELVNKLTNKELHG